MLIVWAKQYLFIGRNVKSIIHVARLGQRWKRGFSVIVKMMRKIPMNLHI